ncbi:cytochrome P450 4F4 [Aplysia californica]|uniref:Cytochrome P450 4F4 n=1 Tax=Aplysia californica TaxID=6500 RepID=A0ABM0K9L7_APLCA|nr:cytochrome P450 4F4 [Aplysia californica]XP_012945718.1 cytochrome P450 4F4 [Aplysia californica]
MLALYILVAVTCVLVVKYLRHFLEHRRTYSQLPGDNDLHWLLGNIHKYPGFNEAGLKFDFGKSEEFKYFHRIWVGPFLAVIQCYHPESIRKVINSSAPKPRNLSLFSSSYDMGVSWLGEGLILTNGARWSRNRRLLTPAFHFDILKNYMKVYNSCVSLMQGQILEASKAGKSFDLQSLVHKCTLDVILCCAFSYQSNCQTEEEASEYINAIEELQVRWSERTLNPLQYIEFMYKLTPGGRRFYHLCDIAHREAEGLIAKRQKELAGNPDAVGQRKVRDFLDTLLTARDEEGKGLTPLEIRDEVDTFMFAGHDTTASGIMWTLVSLSQHPDYQDQVYREVKAVLGDRKELQWEDLSELPFTTQCIKETLRLHSTVPVVERSLTEDITINGHTLPAGSRVALQLWMLHHNPHVWDEPFKFKPDRFHPNKVAKMDPYQFVPFSAGSRNCIGQNFAMNEMKVTVAKIINDFQLRPDADRVIEHKTSVTMKASEGAYMYATPRTD